MLARATAGLGLAAAMAATGLGCAGAPPAGRDAWIITRIHAPPRVKVDRIELRDVDRDTFHEVGWSPGPVVLKVSEGRYRLRRLVLAEGAEREIKFPQPDDPIEVRSCCINYIGDVVFRPGRRNVPPLQVLRNETNTPLHAMAIYPELFDGRPVLMLLPDERPVRLRFEDPTPPADPPGAK
ncbi:MAG: hypothetical protein OXU53_01085 [Deltaproteobacteria bacterium]|nr:hypothetical protein [Deltaproteobacteria bacterium]